VFTVAEGRLAPGTRLDAHGVLSGRPRRGGTYAFTARATDANGVARVHRYLLRVT
jgi:hypothetical protein